MRQLTHGPRHHFFGRAGVSPWNGSETRIACLESAFHGRAPQPGERAQIGIVDPNTGGFSALATTAAWSFLHGAMIEWCRQSPNDELLFNDMVDGSPFGVRLNVLTGARQVYMRPFAAAGGDGARIASVSLGRIARLGAGEGVAGAPDSFADETAPEEDGLFILGLTHGLQRMIVSIASVATETRARHADLRRRDFWFDHVSFNKSGTRLLFTVFAGRKSARADVALWTIGIDGEALREVVPFGCGAVRGMWLDAGSCIATFRGDDGVVAPRVFTDSDDPGASPCAGNITGPVRIVPSPDGARLAVESDNPRRRSKALTILERATGATTALVELRMSDEAFFQGLGRCDLNPRWNQAGNALCVDAVGIEGTRQLHIVPVARDK
ncbi:MAG TPA: hypothetical protein VMM36_06040 [Opitutaceae bacterium]|nr:hypothetical protein [Opitutaceae bacterium]